MAPDVSPSFTQLLRKMAAGDSRAAEDVHGRIDRQLRTLRDEWSTIGRAGRAPEPRDVVHAAYVRLVGPSATDGESRARFYFLAARSLRRLLVGGARIAPARSDAWLRQALREDVAPMGLGEEGLALALDDALSSLEEIDAPLGRLVELRGFAGLNLEEISELFAMPRETVARDWSTARAWLRRELGAEWCGAV